MKTIYIVAGVAGAGKSWVLDNVELKVPKIKADLIHSFNSLIETIEDTKSDIVIVEKTRLVSTLINRLTHHKIRLLIVAGDFLKVKEQLVARGGKVTPGLYKRWKRMKIL